jgi:multicomponent Na+:H+ antiporter subunit D
LKLPYFAFWGGKKTDWSRELKPIPANMYVGMAILAIMCLAQGLAPEILYRYLPYPEEAALYRPWTAWNVLQASMLLGFSGLAFYLMRQVIAPHKALNLDFDWFYRLFGGLALKLVSAPLAFIDGLWTNAWNRPGLKGLMGLARLSSFFDRKAIDGVVDGSAKGVRGLGYIGAFFQNGQLQHYLGLAAILAILIFAYYWYGF